MSTKKKVFIAIEEFGQMSEEPLRLLRAAQFDVLRNMNGPIIEHEQAAHLYKDVTYVVAGLEPYKKKFFEQFPGIRAISRVGVGIDAIDLNAATRNDVRIFVTSDKPSVSVAELCVGNMIALLRGTFRMSQNIKNGDWLRIQGRDLRGSVVGIIGLGSIGKEVAKRVGAFGADLIACGRTWDKAFASDYGVSKMKIEEIFGKADVVTVHLPHTKETDKLISSDLIKTMKRGSIIINTSRAGVIDNRAVVDAILDGTLAGAAIDVFEEARDPYPYSNVDNVILTPHIGSHTFETRNEMELMAVKNIIAYDEIVKGGSSDGLQDAVGLLKVNCAN